MSTTPCIESQETTQRVETFDFLAHLHRQRNWSSDTFGPSPRAEGIVDHIRKELCEIETTPTDITEWIDVVIVALDGAWRSGATPEEIIAALVAKQAKNEGRTWPDWRTAAPGKAIEHVRKPVEHNGADARDALWLFREFVIRNATQWQTGAGGHHHPMWALLSEVLGNVPDLVGGTDWRFIQPLNRTARQDIAASK